MKLCIPDQGAISQGQNATKSVGKNARRSLHKPKNSFGNGRNNDDELFSVQNGGDFQNFIRLRPGQN